MVSGTLQHAVERLGMVGVQFPKFTNILLLKTKSCTTSGCSNTDPSIFNQYLLYIDSCRILSFNRMTWYDVVCCMIQSTRYWRIRVSIRLQNLQLYAYSCGTCTAVLSVTASIICEAVSSVVKPRMLCAEHLVPSKQIVIFKLEDLNDHCS